MKRKFVLVLERMIELVPEGELLRADLQLILKNVDRYAPPETHWHLYAAKVAEHLYLRLGDDVPTTGWKGALVRHWQNKEIGWGG